MYFMICFFILSDFHVHPELFVSLDNYVYPSEDEEIVIDSGSSSNTEGGSVQTAGGSEKLDASSSGPKTKTIRVKRKADENTIKESCWYGVIHLIMHHFNSHWYIFNRKIRQSLKLIVIN